MRILLVNKFLYPKGGDAISTLTTGKLLTEKGHSVFYWGMKHPMNPEYPYFEYFIDNIDYEATLSVKQRISNALKILYSFEAKKKIEKLVKTIRPDIIHLNNFAHQISPSILHVFKKYNIPTVMTMHDYKLVCPSWYLLSHGKPCEKCKGDRYYWCLLRKCTKDSYLKSMVNTLEMYLHHKILHIYDLIDIFISPSRFLMNKIKEIGFKGEIVHLYNFVNLNGFLPEYRFKEQAIIYFGRFSKEKGLFTLFEAIKKSEIKLKIIGEGPLEESLKFRVKREGLNNVEFRGYKTGEDLKNEIKTAMAIVLPSEWYENNPRVVLEAFALGKPVIGSRIGGISELVKDGERGLTFEPGNPENLRNQIENLIKNPGRIVEMGRNARRFAEENFNPESHYQKLMEIYHMAIERHR